MGVCSVYNGSGEPEVPGHQAALPPARKALYEDEEVASAPVIERGSEALLASRPRPVFLYYSDMSLKMAEQFNVNLRGPCLPSRARKRSVRPPVPDCIP